MGKALQGERVIKSSTYYIRYVILIYYGSFFNSRYMHALCKWVLLISFVLLGVLVDYCFKIAFNKKKLKYLNEIC